MLEVKPFSQRERRFRELLNRNGCIDCELERKAADTIRRIRESGAGALLDCVREYDSPIPDIDCLAVSQEEMATARREVSESFLTSLSLARVNARKFHEHQRRHSYVYEDADGIRLVRQIRALRRVGICVGDSFSALLMYALPAQLAGVGEIAVAMTPRRDGSVDPKLLAAAKMLDIHEVYRMSGAHAVAAFAHGAGPVACVDKIVGPGDALTAAAKRLVSDAVGVDGKLGLGELAIVADDSANARFIAVDLLAQAEHGDAPLLALFTTDRLLAEAVRIEADRLVDQLPHAEALRRTLENTGAIYVCPHLSSAIAAVNMLAPARLALMTRENDFWLGEVETAGAVLIGPWAAEAAGDCFAGINPFLPVGGMARFASGLGVDSFVREMPVVEYGPVRLLKTGRHLAALADEENMPAHAGAVRERLELLKLTVD